MLNLDIDKIKIANNVSRGRLHGPGVAPLISSMKQNGLLEPIIVKKVKGNGIYNLVAGHQRLAAAKKLGWKTISAVDTVLDDTPEGLEIANIAENTIRSQPTLQEEGYAYFSLINKGLSITEVASRVGTSAKHVERCILLWKNLPVKYRKLIAPVVSGAQVPKGMISYNIAHQIMVSRVTGEKKTKLLEAARTRKMTNFEIEREAKSFKSEMSKKSAHIRMGKVRRVTVQVVFDRKKSLAYEKKTGKNLATSVKKLVLTKFSDLLPND